MPVTHVFVTHADWDHVMALGMLPDVQVTSSSAAAKRIRSGSARAEIEREGAEVLLAHRAIERLHVEQTVDPPADVRLGPWLGVCRPGAGHTDDGMVVSLPDEHLLVVGDYLSSLEIPAAHASVQDYRETLQMLVGVIERERPLYVVVGHGKPHTSEEALRIADEDLDYVEAVLRYADAGCPPGHAEQIAVPERSAGAADRTVHAANVARACAAAGAVAAPG
jgi:glyoxylase-like metal-dependent hydrolase (beta-lactamase superfamily II)